MAIKHMYLVRHGETADNRALVHQSIDVPLNARGREQAKAVGHTLSVLPIDALITSDTARAQETAAALAAATHITARTETSLRELHRGVLVEGTRHFGYASIRGSLQLFLHANNRAWHNADGENLSEFRDRVASVLDLLAREPCEHVVVVTHRGIINGLRFGMTHGFAGSVRHFVLEALFGRTKNGSITELTYDPGRATQWRVERSNDTRHLRSV